VVPGNDDAIRSCDLIARVIADGIAEGKQRVSPAEMAAPKAEEQPEASTPEPSAPAEQESGEAGQSEEPPTDAAGAPEPTTEPATVGEQ
jgi:small subunit ribosomal protein S2